MGNCLVIQDRKEIKIMSVVDDGGEVLKMPSPAGMRMRSLKVPAAAAAAAAGVDDPAAGAAVRVKLVISKQELKKMLDKEGMSLDDMVSLMRKEASGREQEEEFCCGGWRPALESIPEGSDL
ncbi:hypothetical protein BDA96_05G041500 [Sorghum bicolor]|uniref:Uncharacterized protein n=1 Tax=Sorghum bicolor TaxID=4558 RepID=A0A921QUS4_SORBI|nr:hypothetical protein BDA96_05G041500 [Sorghum bicolor]